MVKKRSRSVYADIYAQVRRIPRGKVATYGQIAVLVGRCTARMVGYAMAVTPDGEGIPWHRVINSEGRISPRAGGDGDQHQRLLLEAEGIRFDRNSRVDLDRVGWKPRKR